jgi:L-aspartate oxidase
LDVVDIRNSLQSLMWRAVGVRRHGDQLAASQEIVERWTRYVLQRQFDDPAGWELQNLLTVARLMVAAALWREESRGVHFREDFPQPDDSRWRVRLWFRRHDTPPGEHRGTTAVVDEPNSHPCRK